VLLGILAGGGRAGADSPDGRYVLRAVRGENPPGTATVYRLDTSSGELCVFRFSPAAPAAARGCVAGETGASADRYTLEAAQGGRGTNQSSAYRLDQHSGVICRFRLPQAVGATLQKEECLPHQAGAPRTGDTETPR
jgi:hypothetical protein